MLGVAVVGSFALSGGVAEAAHEGAAQTMNNQQVTMESFLMDLSAFLENVDAYIEAQEGGEMTMEPMTDTPAADLRVGLNALLKEHVNIGLAALFNVIDEAESTNGAVMALDDNTEELAATIGSVYGDDAEDAFDELWSDHIGYFADYATGLREDDAAMRAEAEDELDQYQQDAADFFTNALPEIPREAIVAGAGEHKQLLLDAMDAYHEGEYEEAYELQREADKQISGLANLLAGEIVAQNPELF